MLAGLFNLILVLALVGFVLWIVERFFPMDATIKSVMIGLVVLAVVLWLLGIFGLWDHVGGLHLG
jgi:hypothetical protein